jgi:hypothetical protein
LWADYLNAANLKLPVVRVNQGVYIFGTKRVTAKILNNKLMIRVGGGYIGAAEFIQQNGAAELKKYLYTQNAMNNKKTNRATMKTGMFKESEKVN